MLPKYRNGAVIEGSEYDDDLERIAEVFMAAPKERRERLVNSLRETPFVRAENEETGELQFARADDVYLKTNRLVALFDGVPVLFAISALREPLAKNVEKLLEDCGASLSLAPIDIDGRDRFSKMECRQMREQAGEVRSSQDESLIDSEFRGLRQLLEHLPSLPAQATVTRAGLLWDALRERAALAEQPGFRGVYKWFYYHSRSTHFDSVSVQLLNQKAWVPDEFGRLRPPSAVRFEALGWPRNRFLESIIQFRQSEPSSRLNALLAEEGVDLEVFEALKEAADELSAGAIVQLLNDQVRRVRIGEPAIHRNVGDKGATEPSAQAEHSTANLTDHENHGIDNSAATRERSGERVFESYIRVGQERTESSEGGNQHNRRMDVEEAGIARILEEEPSLKRTPANNPGYDLYETGEDGTPVRWVEVKALSGTWDSSPVTLSHTQFDLATKRGENYWLYVVEHSGTDYATIIKIGNPGRRGSSFVFDTGWRVAADAAVTRQQHEGP